MCLGMLQINEREIRQGGKEMKLFAGILSLFCCLMFCISYFTKQDINRLIFWGVLAIYNNLDYIVWEIRGKDE